MNKLLLTIAVLSSTLTLHAQTNPYPIVPIDTVQYVSPTKLSANPPRDTPDYISPTALYPFRDTVRIEGIVVLNPRAYALATNTNNPSTSRVSTWLQRKGGGPWSGVQVMLDPSVMPPAATKQTLLAETKFYDNCVLNYPVRMTVRYGQFNGGGQPTGETQMYLIRNTPNSENSVEQLSLTPDTVVYTPITVDQLMQGNPNTTHIQQRTTGEQWEGVLVTIPNVKVFTRTSGSNNRWNWSVIDDNGNSIEIRDVSAYFNNSDFEDSIPKIPNTFTPPTIGTPLTYIRGIITEFSTGNPPNVVNRYAIAPLYPTDIKVADVIPPIINGITKNKPIITPTDSVIISVRTTKGTSGIRNVRLYYSLKLGVDTFETNDSVSLQRLPTDQNIWYGNIPPQALGKIIKYWARATDSIDVSSSFPAAGAFQSYRVISGTTLSIQEIQESVQPNYSTPFANDSLAGIDLRGVITGINFTGGGQSLLTMQSGTGKNSGILIQRNTGDNTSNWKIGDSVSITSTRITETFNTTILNHVRGTVIQSDVTLPPFEVNLPKDSFINNNVQFSRPWEAVLVKFDSVYVINTQLDLPNTNSGEWSFHQNSSRTFGLRVDDMSSQLRNLRDKLKVGMYIPSIQGVMWFSFSNFKLIPRGLSDIDLSNLDTLAPVITLNGNNPDTIFKNQSYVDAGATAIDDKDGDISANIIKTGSVDTATAGTYTLWYKATDAWGNSDSVSRTVVVFDTTAVGLRHNELTYAQFNVYPNPANLTVTLSADFIQTVPVTVAIVDVVGKTHVTRTYSDKKFVDHISVADMPNGVYFINVSNNNGTRTFKLMVNH